MENQTDLIQEFISAAHRRLRSAKASIGVKSYDDSISRSFYAFLDVATAALILKNIHPKSHSGVISFFGLHYIKSNIIDKKFSRWFDKIRQDREEADYRHLKKFSKEEAEEALKAAKIFVRTVESYLKKELNK